MPARTRLPVSCLATALALTCAGFDSRLLLAQDALEEIVVTARRRDESLQQTPVAVSAFGAGTLEQLGLRNIADLSRVVPNVDMYTGNGTTGSGNVFIRGVGARNTGVNFDSGVGIYVDGVYVSRADGAVMDNVDVQSVQVLRGPQGTLFGKNTTGGAFLYTTNRPDAEYGGHAQVRVGNYDQLDSQLTLNVPLRGDTLLSRFSLYESRSDGYVHSEIPDGLPAQAAGNSGYTEDDYNDTDRRGVQAQLRWVATEDLLFDLNYTYGKTDQGARGQNCELVRGIPGAGWQAELQNAQVIVPSTGQSIADWCSANQALGKDEIMANLEPNRYEAKVNTLALTAQWDIDDALKFKSITAARNTEASNVQELDASGISLLGSTNYRWSGAKPRETDAYSQEFQLSGLAFDGRLDFVVGAFGFYEDTDKGVTASPTGPFFNVVPLVSAGQANRAFYTNEATELLARNASASAFGQADWHFDAYWTLTLGARYTWEERRLERNNRIPELATLATTGDARQSPFSSSMWDFPSGPGTFNPHHRFMTPLVDPATGKRTYDTSIGVPDPLADQRMNTDDSKVTPMGSVQRSFEGAGFMDSGLAYFTVAKGFLSGGIADTLAPETGRLYEFDPEEVWSYEAGFKMDAWARRLRLNTAIFYTDYHNRQLTTVRVNPQTGRVAGALINAESSYISGIEIETIVLPVDRLQITFNATFNKSDIEEYDDQRIQRLPPPGTPIPPGCTTVTVSGGRVLNCAVDRSDESLPRLPDSVLFAALQYTFETRFGAVVPMLSWSYRRNLDNCFDVSSCLSGVYKTDQEDLTARLTWTSLDAAWRVSAFGNNITDERYIIGGTPLVDLTETAGTIYNTPRTYGVEAAYTW